MEHLPVLLDECIEGLHIKPDGIYLDGTLGRAGHSIQIAKKLTTGRLIAIDRDEEAILAAENILGEFRDKVTLIHGNFGDIDRLLPSIGVEKVDGMLYDLGVSSPQLDKGERGFSYSQDSQLDMRMDTSGGESALEAVNNWSELNLRNIFFKYGEEKYSKQIAAAIVKKRTDREIRTTFDLNEIIFAAIPAVARREAQHPSKRVFQALRIAINDELGSIEKMLEHAPDMLNIGGFLNVISFHSLEDRLVKNAFISRTRGCTCPKDFPVCICGFKPTLSIITKKPITATREELEVNPRARSAKLRIAKRI